MKINLSPQFRDGTLTLSRQGDVLTVNGEDFDFSPLGEGEMLPAEAISADWFAGPVLRINGELELTLLFPCPADAPAHVAYPEPLHVTADGPITLPS